MLGVIEATVEGDDEKNRLCPPIHFWEENRDYLAAFLATMAGEATRSGSPALASWVKRTRLNPVSGVSAYREEPAVKETRERIKRSAFPAVANLQTLLER